MECGRKKNITNGRHLVGPRSPIIMIIGGGEGEAKNRCYPFVYERLVCKFNSCVIQVEHRFFGQSDPVELKSNEDMVGLLTVANAMQYFCVSKFLSKFHNITISCQQFNYPPVSSTLLNQGQFDFTESSVSHFSIQLSESKSNDGPRFLPCPSRQRVGAKLLWLQDTLVEIERCFQFGWQKFNQWQKSSRVNTSKIVCVKVTETLE